jgi:hypothetical protein
VPDPVPDPVPPPPSPDPIPVEQETPRSQRNWIFPVGWDDHRDALGNKPSGNHDVLFETRPQPSVDRREEHKRDSAQDGDPSAATPPQTLPDKREEAVEKQNQEKDAPDWKTVSPDDSEEVKRKAALHNLDLVFKANPKKLLDPTSKEPWFSSNGQVVAEEPKGIDPTLIKNLKPGVAALLKDNKGNFIGIACIKHPEEQSNGKDRLVYVLIEQKEGAPTSPSFRTNGEISGDIRRKKLQDWERTYYRWVPDEVDAAPTVNNQTPAASTETPVEIMPQPSARVKRRAAPKAPKGEGRIIDVKATLLNEDKRSADVEADGAKPKEA